MKKLLLAIFSFSTLVAAAQEKQIVINRMVKTDTAVTTKGQVTIKGQAVPYNATAGLMPVWDEDGKAIAGVFILFTNELM